MCEQRMLWRDHATRYMDETSLLAFVTHLLHGLAQLGDLNSIKTLPKPTVLAPCHSKARSTIEDDQKGLRS